MRDTVVDANCSTESYYALFLDPIMWQQHEFTRHLHGSRHTCAHFVLAAAEQVDVPASRVRCLLICVHIYFGCKTNFVDHSDDIMLAAMIRHEIECFRGERVSVAGLCNKVLLVFSV
jgi:hypothetical protein